MAANNNPNGKNVFFNGPEDWSEWSLTFKRRAIDADIWKYMETGWPTAPKIPQYAQFEAKPPPEDSQPSQQPRNPSTTRTRATHGIAVPSRSKTPRRNYALVSGRSHTEDDDDGEHNEDESEEVEYSRLHTPRQIRLSDLTENGRMNYQDAMMRYRIKEKQWETTQKDKKALSAWVFDTVHKDYLHLFENKELEEMCTELEVLSKPFETRIVEQTREAYYKHLSSIKRFERKMGLWIALWQKSIKDATKYDLIDIYAPAAWCAHLRKSLSEITERKAWVMGEFAILENRIKRGDLDHNSLAATMQARLSGPPRAEQAMINAGFNTLGSYDEKGKKEKDNNKRKRGNEGSRHDSQGPNQERDRSTRGLTTQQQQKTTYRRHYLRSLPRHRPQSGSLSST
ncbi:hypothetical protein V8F06_014457 [Rhypophila decipiens]